MRIKQLELCGFKSFPQRTALDLPAGVTAIVGPNGCGKSNVVDAVRWVLGEQSPKHLRGDGMEAVVFNGNERLGPLGMAEVSLTFDNDGPRQPLTDLDLELSTIPAHLRTLPEITITRRYFRSGESEYFINRTACRLKDITELFLGTGVGSKAYAIIEQGRVEQLINAKPEDRRLFIEEAAGTTLYRSRKLAAERKMERTRENLERVNDVLREIDRQTQYLARQAKKAETHRRLSAEVRELELRIARRQWRGLHGDLAALDEARQRLAAGEAELRAAIEAGDRARREASDRVAEGERRQATLRESLAVLAAERQNVRARLELLDREREERERRQNRLGHELESTSRALGEAVVERHEAEREQEATAQGLLFEEGELTAREARFAAARVAAGEALGELERVKGALIEHTTREIDHRNRRVSLERRREEIGRQIARLDAEQVELAARLMDLERQGADRRRELSALRAELAAANVEHESRANQLSALAEARRRAERQAAELEGVLVKARSRIESLQTIQHDYEGFHRGVRAVMRTEHHADGVLGVVADVIDIPEPYERAVAAVLGERLQYVVVEAEEHGASAVDRLRREESGRGSFIPLRPRYADANAAASFNGTSKPLLDVVRVADDFRGVAEALLGGVVLVPDLTTAISLYRRNGVHVTFVTPQGDVIDPAGVITGGSDRPIEEEILARRREIESLRATEEAVARELAAGRAEAERLGGAVLDAEAGLRAMGEGTHDLTVRIVGAEKDVERLELERPRTASRCDVVRYERDALAEEMAGLGRELDALEAGVAELEARRSELDRALQDQRAAADEAQARAESLGSEVTAMKVQLAGRRERRDAAFARLQGLRRQEGELSQREATLRADIQGLEQEREALVASLVGLRDEESRQAERRAELDAALGEGEGDLGVRREALTAEEERARRLGEELDRTREERSRTELKHSELRLRSEHLETSMHEKYDCPLATMAAEAEEPEVDADVLAREPAELDEMKARLQRIGDVNLAAIDELRELEERSGFLRTQRDDLERSLGDLQRTIQKLNRASRARFAETFARADEMFRKIFPRLFCGGEARLVLTNEADLLEAGVEIVARPPGKRLDSVGPLSGGEKALVAVSLIFSLFLINPTPFCILDEVDAPLDDANIGRFRQMIREMSEHSQFIVITHNKKTMESADVLYGVTMQEPGVSKVISVSLH